MKLYHYSCEPEYIFKNGLVPYEKHEDTQLINTLISTVVDCLPLDRGYCIFLSFDKRVEGVSVFSVDTEKLDLERLFVANQDLADEIFRLNYKGLDCSEIIREYVSSIVSYKDYKGAYEKAELMYEGFIACSLLTKE